MPKPRALPQEAVQQRGVRPDIDREAAIDAFYAPIYYRLQMGTGTISEVYVDRIFQQAMEGQLIGKEETLYAGTKKH